MVTAIAAQPEILRPVLEDSLDKRFKALFNSYIFIRYEAILYGPLGAYLHAMFPTSRQYLNKPQEYLLPEKKGEKEGNSEEEAEIALCLSEEKSDSKD